MQLVVRSICLSLLIGMTGGIYAQTSDSAKRQPVDINFLLNYYEQEGSHAAVTGGRGSEELTDKAVKIVAYIPVDSVQALSMDVAVNQYTSASTDQIDFNVSSASFKDSRAQLRLHYVRRILQKRQEFSLGIGGSLESDYVSTSFHGTWQQWSADENRIFSLNAQLFLDKWVVIFPEELRAPGLAAVPTDKRRSFSVGLNYTQIINPRLQISLTAEWVAQFGLLSTPFHRVYFQHQDVPRIERLPQQRFKYPLGIQAHYFLGDYLIIRSYYRAYFDSFGVNAHTFNLETPIKLSPFFSVYPFYRYHTQRAARYFAPFAQHVAEAEFYSSDFDLSALQSHKIGLGISYAPLYGLAGFKLGRPGRWRGLDLRYARYLRSDGLSSHSITLDLGFRLE